MYEVYVRFLSGGISLYVKHNSLLNSLNFSGALVFSMEFIELLWSSWIFPGVLGFSLELKELP